jgi:hypothetical protein
MVSDKREKAFYNIATCPKNMSMKELVVPLDMAVARAENMNGAEMNRPIPQITVMMKNC